MAKKSKLELVMELSDKLFNNKLNQVQNKLNAATSKMEGRLSKFSSSQIRMAGMVAGAFAAIGGGMLLHKAFDKSVDAAQKFDSAFLPIKQLNLDKSASEISNYRNSIRDAAFEVGTNLEKSTNAMYDLQSATGVYGDDAVEIFKKVGRYSIATGADLNDSMNSTTKAMKAFGIGVEGIDKLLASNAKTVQVGITTFDELAKVQTEYAGATSAAGQTVDVGNKIFAMFTSISKSSDIAANMTKTFFQGLGQQSKQIKDSLNIDVFNKDGTMKEADALLTEISKKFENMSDKQITEAINKIGGPEGLRGALSKVKTGAEDMINTFNSFDNSSFSLEQALKNAEGDFATMKEMFNNRLESVFSKIGEKILPVLAGIFDKLNPMLEWLYQNIDWLLPAIGSFATVVGVATAAQWLWNAAMTANPVGLIIVGIAALIALVTAIIVKWDEWGAALTLFLGPIGLVIGMFKSLYDHWDSIKKAFQTDGIIGGLKRIGIVLLDALLKPIQQLLEMLSKIPGLGGLAQAGVDRIKGIRERLDLITPGEKEAAAKANKTEENSLYKPTETKKPKGTADNKHGDNVEKVAGQANQVRKIDIKIDSFNKGGINVAPSDFKGMTLADVEAWFKEAMMRVILNAENA